MILQGVKIGRGSIIGARSVVTKDVPPYSIYVGTRILRKRFPDDIIDKLMSVNYRTICHRKNDKFEQYWNEEVNEENVDEIIDVFVENK